MLPWFRRKAEPPPAVKFARGVGESLDWWLIGLDDTSPPIARNPRILDGAMNLHGEGQSRREATCFLANAYVGDIILRRRQSARNDALAYMREPGVADVLMGTSASDCVMMLDLLDSSSAETQALLTPETRGALQATIMERVNTVPLDADAQRLFAGIRHLWERAIVAVSLERDNKNLREMAGHLIDECIYSLAGDDAAARRGKHLALAIEQLVNKSSAPGEPQTRQ
jgi:hypothetical protein